MKAPAQSLQKIQVTEREAAELVGVCTRTLYAERIAGRLKAAKLGKKVLYRIDELDRWSRENQNATAQSESA